jgi:uncharacterized protein (TIGR04255 family)
MGITLKNKPLIEAIFELRWELQERSSGIKTDPHYRILIGSMYDRVRKDYSIHEQLPTADMPDEIAGYVIQHRFRKGVNEWPLIQMGPGIITLNETDGYVWDDFKKRIIEVIKILFEIHPIKENPKINGLLLRYIDAVDFSYDKNIFDFLKDSMGIGVSMRPDLFEDKRVKDLPLDFDIRLTYPLLDPAGSIQLRFVRGKRNSIDALIWETIVNSIGNDIPQSEGEIINWLDKSHDLTHDWFFKIIDGELLRRFE